METLKFGLNSRLRHEPTWNGLESGALAPSVLLAVPLNDIGLQLVGLNMKLDRSITASIVRRSVGTPSTICGSGSVVTVICAVFGSTAIERTGDDRAEVERSRDHRGHDRQAERRAPIRPGQIDRRGRTARFGHDQREWSRTGLNDRVADL